MKNTNKIKQTATVILYLFIYFLFGFIILQSLKTNSLSGDDEFTFAIIHHHFLSIIGLTANDVHPFLYYFLARACILPFKNIFTQIKILKLVSALPYLIMLIIADTTIKHRFSTKTSLIFMFLLITTPVLNQYMLASRMYGWTMLFTTVIFLLLVYVYKNVLKNSLPVFLGISLLMLADFYTQYDAIISVFIIMGFFLILFIHSKIHVKNLIISMIISILLYLPWIKIMVHQTKYVSGSSYYAPRFILKLMPIYKCIKNFILSLFILNPVPSRKDYLFLLVFFLLIILGLYYSNITHLSITILGLLLPFILMIFGLLICIKEDHQILYSRYLMSALGIFWFCIANIIVSISSKNHIYTVLEYILLLLTLMIGLKSYQFSYNQMKPQVLTSSTRNLCRAIPSNSHIVFDNPAVMQQLYMYTPHTENYIAGSRCRYFNKSNLVNIWSNKGKKAIQGSIYKKVFKGTHVKKNLQPLTYKNSYFVRASSSNTRSSLGKQFYYKNKNKMRRLKSTHLLIYGKVTLYKMR